MKCREKDRASIDVNENTVILKTKLIRPVKSMPLVSLLIKIDNTLSFILMTTPECNCKSK